MSEKLSAGDVVDDVNELHSNHEDRGACCPHCFEDTPNEVVNNLDEGWWRAVECPNCGKLFGAMLRRVREIVSGLVVE